MTFASISIIVFLLIMVSLSLYSLKMDGSKRRKIRDLDDFASKIRMDDMGKKLDRMIERGDRGIKKYEPDKKSDIDRLNDSIK